MRTIAAIVSALSMAVFGVFVAMPAMSNGGFLDGCEFFGLGAIGALCSAVYALVSQAKARKGVLLWVQAIAVGLCVPIAVLFSPLVYCIFFQTGKSCM